MRPWNETNDDLDAESEVANILSEHSGESDGWFKLPISYHFDICFTNNERATSFVEIKCRNVPSDRYDTVYISLIKIMAGLQLQQATGLKAYFVWQWSDNVITIQNVREPDFVEINGNTRGQNGDIEPVGHYDISKMQRIE